jgi:putative transposase
MKQPKLRFSKDPRGGARAGAGRKPLAAGLRRTPHRARPRHRASHPVHVMLRASVRSLRTQHVVRTVLDALRESNGEQFRIIQYSVQANHLHLIVEAENKNALSSGMRGLAVRLARRVNKLLFRRGKFWVDRWHGRTLESPRQVRNALVHVLQNHKKHAPAKLCSVLDPLSSAEWFDGFVEPIPQSFRGVGPPSVARARTWLLRTGWHRHGLIRVSEAPRSGR